MNRSEHEESFISGKGKLSGDGKPEVVIFIDLNCDRLLQLAGDSVFESKKVKEKNLPTSKSQPRSERSDRVLPSIQVQHDC